MSCIQQKEYFWRLENPVNGVCAAQIFCICCGTTPTGELFLTFGGAGPTLRVTAARGFDVGTTRLIRRHLPAHSSDTAVEIFVACVRRTFAPCLYCRMIPRLRRIISWIQDFSPRPQMHDTMLLRRHCYLSFIHDNPTFPGNTG